MTVLEQQIRNALDEIDFSDINNGNYRDILTSFDDKLRDEHYFEYQAGASKVVIIFDELDYVIKIPFTGYDDWGDYSDSYIAEYYGSYDRNRAIHNFDYANNSENKWDYCALEVDVWESICSYTLDKKLINIFLKTELMYRNVESNYPIYKQPKCQLIGSWNSPSNHKKSNDKIWHSMSDFLSRNYCHYPPSDWVLEVLRKFGAKFCLQLIRLIEDLHLDDLHSHNVGYTQDGTPVIFDYCGFYD